MPENIRSNEPSQTHPPGTEGEIRVEKQLPPKSRARDRIRERASGVAERVDHYTDTAATRVGSGLSGSAGRIRTGADSVAHRLESAGDYLQRSTGRDLIGDVTDVMKRHPKITLGVGFGLGFLLARSLRR